MLTTLLNVLLFCKIITCVTLNYNTTYILDYVKSSGYAIEVHNVQTKDDFILNIHRIRYKGNKNSAKGVVLLAHGLQESAEHWIINGNKSLALLLSNLGYDVWLTNARGCYHSKYHVKYNTNNPKYWDFSWHEIAIYDLPVTIDYILSLTKVPKLSYVGHSQGATTFFVLTTEKPEYNDKFNVMISLAPAVYMSHVKNPIFRTLANMWELIYPNKGLLDNALVNIVVENFCKNRLLMQSICTNVLFFTGGYDYEQLDHDIMFEITRSMPAGSSTKQLIHYVQLVRSGYFRKYDYHSIENLRRYGSTSPIIYNLSKTTGNIALYYAKNDWLSVPEDVQRLRDELINANIVVDNLLEYEHFNHFDFLFAKDVVPLLYNHVIETLDKYN